MTATVSPLPARPHPAACHLIIPAAGCSRRLAALTRDRPKSLLEIDGTSIIEHSLDILDSRGFRRATFVVGYRRDVLVAALGTRHRRIAIDYVVNEDYESTEHGWSLQLSRAAWEPERRTVFFMDADNLYDPLMLDRLVAAPPGNVVLVDDAFEAGDRDEELVSGRDGAVTGLARGRPTTVADCVGGFVGINRFEPDFMAGLYAFGQDFLSRHDRRQKYERVIDAYLRASGAAVRYVCTGGLPWINVNHEDEYTAARDIARSMARSASERRAAG